MKMDLQKLTIQVTEAIQRMRMICKDDHAGRMEIAHGVTGYILFSTDANKDPYKSIGMNVAGQLILHSASLDGLNVSAKQVTVDTLVQWALDGSDGDIDQAHEDLFDSCYFVVWDAHTRKVPEARATCTKIAEIFDVTEPVRHPRVDTAAEREARTGLRG